MLEGKIPNETRPPFTVYRPSFLTFANMRIAINTRFLLEGKLEGMGWFTYQVVKQMAAQHPEDEFILFFDRPYSEAFIFSENIKAVVLFPPARHPFLYLWWFEWSVVQALKKYKADVFLSPDNFLSLRTKTPSVLVIHDAAYLHYPEQVSFWDRWHYQTFTPRFVKKADQIITVSNYTRKDILNHFTVDENKISVACNGCREMFKPLPENEKQKIREEFSGGKDYFFYIGAVQPRKNVHRLIAAFDIFKKRTNVQFKLLIAGRFGWQTGAVKTAYENAEFKEDIVFLGYTENEVVAKLMAASYALTYPSLFEGFGIPLLEAMHCEVPILTSTTSSMPEVAGDAGILVEPESEEKIANAMQQLSENSHLYKQLIENGKKQRQKFSWEKAASVVYESLLKASKAK